MVELKSGVKRERGLVWSGRWRSLKEAGLSDEQVWSVYFMLSEMRVFKFNWLQASAERQLIDVLRENKTKEGLKNV